MIEWVRCLLGDQCQSRILADDCVELLVVNMEWLCQKVSRCNAGRHKQLCSIGHSGGGHIRWPDWSVTNSQNRGVARIQPVNNRRIVLQGHLRTIEASLIDHLGLRRDSLSLYDDRRRIQQPLHMKTGQHGQNGE